jgi:hypothetical protein
MMRLGVVEPVAHAQHLCARVVPHSGKAAILDTKGE